MKHPINYHRLSPGDRYFVNANGVAVRLTRMTKGEEYDGRFYPDGEQLGYAIRVKPEPLEVQAAAHHDYQHEIRERVSAEESGRMTTIEEMSALWK